MHGYIRNSCKILVEKSEGKRAFFGVVMLEEINKCGLELCDSEWDSVAGLPNVVMKLGWHRRWEYLDWLSDCQFPKKDSSV
jgi:hypothetical protein